MHFMKDMGHKWVVDGDPREGGDVRCRYCDCRPGGRYASEPCEAANVTVS